MQLKDVQKARNVQNMKPVQFCIGFIFCTLPAIVTQKIERTHEFAVLFFKTFFQIVLKSIVKL